MVAIVVKNAFAISIVTLLVSACVPYGRLNVKIEREGSVEIVTRHTTGEEKTLVLEKCENAFLYQRGYEITNVEIFVSGKLIDEWNNEEIQRKLAVEDDILGFSAWVVTNEGVALSTQPESGICKADK